MPVTYTFGETVYDIIFENRLPVSARAGGAMLNTAVSLGRAGQQVVLLTEIGNDDVGNQVIDFLEENHVITEFILPNPDIKTPVSLAFLDDKKEASYSFYKHYPKDRLAQELPSPMKGDIVLFGSFYALIPEIRGKMMNFLNTAKNSGALIIYDPNIRRNHMQDLTERFLYVMENISIADIVRGSDEDFENLFRSSEQSKVFNQVQELGCKYVIITRSSKGAELITEDLRLKIPSNKVKVVSTIGAGDSFNAGIIYRLGRIMDDGKTLQDLSEDDWKTVLQSGAKFAEDTCRSFDNYISQDFGGQVVK